MVIARDADNYALLSERSHSVPYESTVGSEVVVEERKVGQVEYEPFFVAHWGDEEDLPHLHFWRPPREVRRRYGRGDRIELGLEEVNRYHVVYADGVEATFEKSAPDRYEFSFSTGFYGACWKDPDGSCTIRFKGDRLDPAEEALHSQSKFIVSRSKYSGNLLLILQDDAVVQVS